MEPTKNDTNNEAGDEKISPAKIDPDSVPGSIENGPDPESIWIVVIEARGLPGLSFFFAAPVTRDRLYKAMKNVWSNMSETAQDHCWAYLLMVDAMPYEIAEGQHTGLYGRLTCQRGDLYV